MTYPDAIAANIKAGLYDFNRGVEIMQEASAISYREAHRLLTAAVIRRDGVELKEVK